MRNKAWQAGYRLHNGKYQIEKELGCGGFGITYLAINKKCEQVVIKTLNENARCNRLFDKFRQDFLNEAIRLAKCSHHPHIVKIIELFEEEELLCIVMEYIPGKNLAEVVEQRNIEEAEAIYYIRQIGEALEIVHEQGLLHRDVKPQNIIIRDDGKGAVLIDFGIAREYYQGNSNFYTSFISEGYSPLEQHPGNKEQAAYTDVYALAGSLYYVLTAQVPQDIQVRHYNLIQYQQDSLVAPKEVNSEIGEQINTAIIKGMSINPDARPQTINAWLDLLPHIPFNPRQTTIQKSHSTHNIKTRIINNSYSRKCISWRINQRFFIKSVFYLVLLPSLIIFYLTNQNYLHQYGEKLISLQHQEYIYENHQYGFKIKYSNKWQLNESKSHDFTRKIAEVTSNNYAKSRREGSKIILEVISLDKNFSLSEMNRRNLQTIAQFLPSSTILQNQQTYLGGQQAYLLVYEGMEGKKLVRRMRISTVRNKQEYALTFESNPNDYHKWKQSAQNIIDSFDWL